MIYVIGLGQVGVETFKEIAKNISKENVCGVDINPNVVLELRNEGFKVEDRFEELNLAASDVVIIAAYSTEEVLGVLRDLKKRLFVKSLDCVDKMAFDKINKMDKIDNVGYTKPLVIIESTLNPKAINDIKKFSNLFELVSFPHRFNPNDKEHYVFNLCRVLGAVSEEGRERGIRFYMQFMDKNLIHVTSFEISVLSKLLENAYRFTEIAIAESLKLNCVKLGIDFDELRKAANTKWNIDIKEARDGIYGKCLPKDMNLFLDFFDNGVFKAAVDADMKYKEWYRSNGSRIGVK